jgi:F420-dependent methylenetetrahydromethanopterin dehydrogenase
VNVDVHKIGNFTRGIRVNELLDEVEAKPGIKFQFVAKFARIKNEKVNNLVDQIGNQGVMDPKDKFIVIKRKIQKSKAE